MTLVKRVDSLILLIHKKSKSPSVKQIVGLPGITIRFIAAYFIVFPDHFKSPGGTLYDKFNKFDSTEWS